MSTTHLFGGSAKAWQPPSFSKEEPRPKFKQSFSQPLFASFRLSTEHPDEEKGRSIRSTTRIPSNPTALFSQPIVGLEEPFELNDELEDSAFFDSWRADRGIEGEGEDDVGDLVQALKETSTTEETETPSRVNSNDAVEWTKVLSHAVDNSDGNVDLSHKNLTRIPDSISDLGCIRKISTLPARLFSKQGSQSTPTLPFVGAVTVVSPTSRRKPVSPSNSPRSFGRSSSIASSPSARAPVETSVPLDINLARNQLTTNSLSNKLFELDNLRCLYLRNNELERLPPAIGRLTNLTDLSLAANQLEFLPAEILQCEKLANLLLHPNPFLAPPSQQNPTSPSSTSETSTTQKKPPTRLLGPLTTNFTLPSLRELAIRTLLEADPHHPSQRLIQRWEATSVRESLPSHNSAPFISTFPPSSSLSTHLQSPYARARHASNSSVSSQPLLPQPFDPLATICRSPHHPDEERIFLEPAVERIEWVQERMLKPRAIDPKPAGQRTIPIKWRGCGAHCLDWLEEEEEEEGNEGKEEGVTV